MNELNTGVEQTTDIELLEKHILHPEVKCSRRQTLNVLPENTGSWVLNWNLQINS